MPIHEENLRTEVIVHTHERRSPSGDRRRAVEREHYPPVAIMQLRPRRPVTRGPRGPGYPEAPGTVAYIPWMRFLKHDPSRETTQERRNQWLSSYRQARPTR